MAVVSLFADGRVVKQPKQEFVSLVDRAKRIQKVLDKIVSTGVNGKWESWDIRRSMCMRSCWFLVSDTELNKLARYMKGKKVLEIAAGTGWLAMQMRLRGVTNYRAIDARCSYYDPKDINYGVEIVDFYSITKQEMAKYDIVVLTWPPYDTSLAYDVFRKMAKRQTLIYQGEFFGCTGNDEFHEALNNHCVELAGFKNLMDDSPQWCGIRDRWWGYVKLRNYRRGE